MLILCFVGISFGYIFGTLLTANGSLKELNIIKDHYLVKEGYSLSEIEEMDTERYDYLIWFILEKNIQTMNYVAQRKFKNSMST